MDLIRITALTDDQLRDMLADLEQARLRLRPEYSFPDEQLAWEIAEELERRRLTRWVEDQP